jgi:hypothetical protein
MKEVVHETKVGFPIAQDKQRREDETEICSESCSFLLSFVTI